ncbi:MAG: polysaccharide biosynthesis C-terminal domain-containing protein [Oscillospiraceae bacterium]|nr:polysaccharide biosynthesis C-terminal domain-containing protein [Oscillospiraceae bacterium]
MDKYKKLASDTIIFSIGTFSSKILSTLLLGLYTGAMARSEFGLVTKMQNLVSLIAPIAILSIDEAVIRFGVRKELSKKSVYSSSLCVALFGILISLCIFPIIGISETYRPYIQYMILLLFTSQFRWINQQYAKVKNYVKLFAADGILSTITLTLFSVLFLVVFKMTIKGYMLAIILSDVVSIIFLSYMADMRRDFDIKLIDKKLISEMIRYTAPLIPTTVLWWVVSSSDLYMVSFFSGEDACGLYSASYRLPNLISVVSIVFFRAWQMSAISNYDSAERKKFYTKVLDAYTSVMFVASAGLMLLIKPLTMLIVDEEFHIAYRYSPYLIVGVLMMSLCTFLSSIYNASNQNGMSFKTSILAAGINIVLNIPCILIFGPQGAAFSTMMAYLVCAVVRIVTTQQIARYGISWEKFGINVLAILVMAVVIIKNVPLMYLWLSLLFAVIALVNYGPIEATIKKFIKR